MANVISYHVAQPAEGIVLVECCDSQTCVTDDYRKLYHFITRATGHALIPRVVWSLRDTVPILLSLLPEHIRKEVSESNRATWEDKGLRYRVYVQCSAHDPSDYKFFSTNVRGAGQASFEVNVYELDQFFPDDREPSSIAEVQSCVVELLACFESFGVSGVKALKSPVAVIEESGLLDELYESLPDPAGIPAAVKAWAVEVDTFAVWQSAFQVGYFSKVYSYDISSCYPGRAIKLLDLTGAEYRYSRKILADAAYGFLQGKLTINPDHPRAWCSPVVFPVSNYGQTNPVGVIKGKFTLEQVRYIQQSGLGEFKLSSGWFIFPKSNRQPFADVMQQLYQQRQQSLLASQFGKRVIDGIIGRLGEFHDNIPTPRTNPVYHALIRTGASLQVGRFLWEKQVKQSDLVLVNTDGFYTLSLLSGVPERADIGEWRYDGTQRLLVLSSQKYRTDESCDYLLDEIRANLDGYRYDSVGGINLLTLWNDQERVFKDFPQMGVELLSRVYNSDSVRLPK